MGNLITIVHPAHGIIGDILTIILCAVLIFGLLMVGYWIAQGAFRSLFGVDEDVPDITTEEQKALYALPIGSARDGGNNFYMDGWRKMTQEQAAAVREYMKLKAKQEALQEDYGWEIRGPETQPVAHPEKKLEITNGPDDVEEEDEVERPDERMVFVSE